MLGDTWDNEQTNDVQIGDPLCEHLKSLGNSGGIDFEETVNSIDGSSD